jgi:FkbM family methyltransferase
MKIKLLRPLERRLKFLLRSRSLSFALNYSRKPSRETSFLFRGFPFYYRTATSDVEVLANMLLVPTHRSEYAIATNTPIKTILDIGGNIGTSAIYFARNFPAAVVHVFEPVPANYALLAKNVRPYQNIRPVNLALSDKNGLLPIFQGESNNNGGFSLHGDQGKQTAEVICNVRVKNVREWLKENDVTQIDLIKIDTEGSECEILMAIPPEILGRVTHIIGEFHGVRDEEMFTYLRQWFDLNIDPGVMGLFRAIRRTGAAKPLVKEPA